MPQVPAEAFSLLYETDLGKTKKAFDNLSRGEVFLLGFSGKMLSGKDTIAQMVIHKLGGEHSSVHEFYSRFLKNEINEIIRIIQKNDAKEDAINDVNIFMKSFENHSRIVVNYLWDDVKNNNSHSGYDRTETMRTVLQYWGTDFRRKVDNDYWVKKTMESVIDILSKGKNVYITDSRFCEEVDAIQRAGGYTVRLKVSRDFQNSRLRKRDNIEVDESLFSHISEKALDDYEEKNNFSLVVDTDDITPAEVCEKVLTGIRHDFMLKQPLNGDSLKKDSTNPKKFFVLNPSEKIILGVDLDEVCFDYLGGFRKRLENKGMKIPEGKMTSWSFMKSGWVESEEEYKKLHSEEVLEGLYLGLDVLPGVVEVTNDLSDSGYEINIITARFVVPGQHEIVVKETAQSLDQSGIPYSNIMFQKNKTRFLADAYLDDGPRNITALRKEGRYVIKFNQLYNRHLGGPSVDTWEEARHLLKERFGR